MAINLNREGVALNGEERNKRNQNWVTIEEGFTGIGAQIKNVIDEAGEAAFDKVIDASKLEWQEPVATFSDLATTYPDATEAFTSQTTSDGSVYRFNGSEWKKIQQVDAGPINEVDTRLTAQLAETQNQLTDISYSVKLFGAKGNGTADDTAAIQLALGSGYSIFFPKGVYKITSPITATYTAHCNISGNKAVLLFAPTSHKEYMIRLSGAGVKFRIEGIEFDGQKMCNKPLEIQNNAANMQTENQSLLLMADVVSKRAKRDKLFPGGSGILVRGAFSLASFENVSVTDCELPLGQGTSGSVGISGISITHLGDTGYVKKTNFKNVLIEKVYSSDLSYTADQDGIVHITPTTGLTGTPIAEMNIENSTFTNCYGRSIKSQVFTNSVKNCTFIRSEGFSSKIGNEEINFQYGGGRISGCTYIYSNGFVPITCSSIGSADSTYKTSAKIDDCEVHLDVNTTLVSFFTSFPRDGYHGRFTLSDIKIYGKVQHPVIFRGSTGKNFISVADWFVESIVNGVMGDKALVYLQGSTSTEMNVSIQRCVYAGTEKPAIARDGITNLATTSYVSSLSNIGFANDETRNPNANGLKTSQALLVGKIGPDPTKSRREAGYFEVQTQSIGAGETREFKVKNVSATLLFINASFNQEAFAVISSSNSANITIAKGTAFGIGNNSEPETGIFRVWSGGSNILYIKNTNTASRVFSVFEMANY